MSIDRNSLPPVLRWAGSKRRLIGTLREYWDPGYTRYIEPFAGSAALFFALRPERSVLADTNGELIATTIAIRDHPRAVHNRLARYASTKAQFLALRSIDPNTLDKVERAARFIFLNRNCFNGLYRTNLSGQFNVPYAPQRAGNLPELEQLRSASEALKDAKILCMDFEKLLLSTAKEGDFVYLDPPYAVENRRIFRQYGSHTFGLQDIDRLSSCLDEIDRRGASFVLSYAQCPEARTAFRNWDSRLVYTQRNIAGFSHHRRKAAELIFTNI